MNTPIHVREQFHGGTAQLAFLTGTRPITDRE